VLHAAHAHGSPFRLGDIPVVGHGAGEGRRTIAETDLDVGRRYAVGSQFMLDLLFDLAGL